MPTPLVSDGREPLPSDSNGVGAQKESRKITFGVSVMTAFGINLLLHCAPRTSLGPAAPPN
eukprot:2428273-Pleurochrysis_carterae.AAC.1